MKKPRDVGKLKRWCIRRRRKGVSVSEICASAQVPRRTFYNWLNQYQKDGLEGLKPTLGKIERWFRTYDLEHAKFDFHWKFIKYCNHKRPHEALNYLTPATVYFRDFKV